MCCENRSNKTLQLPVKFSIMKPIQDPEDENMQNKECPFVIDKTKNLEEGIRRFPAIYIEGNAATGKTTAVELLLQKNPKVSSSIYRMEWELREPQMFLEKLQEERKRMNEGAHWLVLDHIPREADKNVCERLAEMVQQISNQSRVIFVSREKPQIEFLRLLWGGYMELITMEQLLFSQEEIRLYVEETQTDWTAQELYERTGGWAGGISMLVRLAKRRSKVALERTIPVFESYEMRCYVEEEIMSGVNAEELRLLRHMAALPWVKEVFCSQVWGFENTTTLLHNLYRKGMLIYNSEKKYWELNGLFRNYIQPLPLTAGAEADWFEKHGFLAEALWCLTETRDEEAYRACMLRNYKLVASAGCITDRVLNWTGKDFRECYFRGVYFYRTQQFERLEKEIATLEKMKEQTHEVKEVILNLSYLNPALSLKDWLALLTKYTKDGDTFYIYFLLGCGVTNICGIRDLSGLFVGSKKEVKQMEKLWRHSFSEYEWKCYQMAKIDFYLETDQKDALTDEEWALLRSDKHPERWQLRLSKFYLLCKLQREYPEEGREEKIYALEKSLLNENNHICVDNTKAVAALYAPWYGKKEKLTQWLRDRAPEGVAEINESNYLQCFCTVKGYLLLNQYVKAEKLIRKLVPYLQPYHRNRLMSELLFQQGIVYWKKELKGQAIRCAIESFLICGSSRYVAYYASYGPRGCALLEAYIDWQHANAPEGWSRKKKYNYGNVLRMPVEDYVQVVYRSAKKVSRNQTKISEDYIEEQLTMMETMVLQNIARGMSNAQICEVLGLKLPTVKGHAYSLYRKLGVENRTQAVRMGRELGIIE